MTDFVEREPWRRDDTGCTTCSQAVIAYLLMTPALRPVVAVSTGAALFVVLATAFVSPKPTRSRSCLGTVVDGLVLLALLGGAIGVTAALTGPLSSSLTALDSGDPDASMIVVVSGALTVSFYAFAWPTTLVWPWPRTANGRVRLAVAGGGLLWWACVTALALGAAAAYAPELQSWRVSISLLYGSAAAAGFFVAMLAGLKGGAARRRAQAFTRLDRRRVKGLWWWDGRRWWPPTPPSDTGAPPPARRHRVRRVPSARNRPDQP